MAVTYHDDRDRHGGLESCEALHWGWLEEVDALRHILEAYSADVNRSTTGARGTPLTSATAVSTALEALTRPCALDTASCRSMDRTRAAVAMVLQANRSITYTR